MSLDGKKELLLTTAPSSGVNPDTGYIYKWVEKVGSEYIYKCRDENGSDFNIGSNASSQFFEGLIDDVRIYNRALSAEEITRLYELGGTTHVNVTLKTNPDLENGSTRPPGA